MRLKSIICGTASVLVLGAAVPAFAQTATPTSPDPTNNPATADAQARSDDAATETGAVSGDELVVTGLRRSLQSAQAIKRNAVQQIDSVVAEDIGKLPDVAVSDTAARIVGVQVDRANGEAGRVLVRGLPDFTTTYNGREIFTAEARSVALQDFPSGAISAVEVFKTTTADLVEGGLAGEINVRSRRPFDFDGFKIAGSVWGQYQSRSDAHDPNGNILITDRWNTGVGEIGALAIFSYTRLRYLDSTRSNTDYVGLNVGGTGLNFPDIQRVGYNEGDRERPSVNAAVQWRPMEGLEFYAEGLWQGYRRKVTDRETSVPLWGGQSYADAVANDDGSGRADSVTVTNPFRPDGFDAATHEKTDTFQYAVGGRFDRGPLHVTADLARTTSKFTDSVYSFDFAYAHPVTVQANTGLTGVDDGPAIRFLDGTDPNDPSTYVYRGFYDRQLIAKGDDWQGRFDVAYDVQSPIISQIQVGARYVDRHAHFEDGSRYQNREGLPLPDFLDYEVKRSGFPNDDPTGLTTWYAPTYDSIRSHIEDLRALSGFASGTPPLDPAVTYSSNEKSWAGYGQVKYAFGPDDGIHVDGAIGVRVVKTKFSIDGSNRIHHPNDANNQPVADTFEAADSEKDYTDWLPNANARVHLRDDLQLRLSFTKTRSRPGFGQYDPGFTVDPGSSGNSVRYASGGNPNLDPLKTNNYDVSLEYYFSKSGSASVAVFRRDLNGFIQNTNFDIDDPSGIIRVNRPFNTGKGRIDGAEAQVTTFLDFPVLPTFLHAFGFDANVTYLDAKTGFPALDANGFPVEGGVTGQSPILGVSKWTYNLAAFYEQNGFTARLSWNHRGAYSSRYELRGPVDTYSETVHGIGRLDLSTSFDVNKDLTIFFDATNILGKPYVADLTYGFNGGANPVTYPRLVRYEESVFSLGTRFRF